MPPSVFLVFLSSSPGGLFSKILPQQKGGLGEYAGLITGAEFTEKNVIFKVVLFVPKFDVLVHTKTKNQDN